MSELSSITLNTKLTLFFCPDATRSQRMRTLSRAEEQRRATLTGEGTVSRQRERRRRDVHSGCDVSWTRPQRKTLSLNPSNGCLSTARMSAEKAVSGQPDDHGQDEEERKGERAASELRAAGSAAACAVAKGGFRWLATKGLCSRAACNASDAECSTWKWHLPNISPFGYRTQ